MDLDKVLNNFACRDDLVQYVKGLPDDAEGLLIFRYTAPENPTDEYGPITTLGYKVYGALTPPEQLWLAHIAIDFAREET